MSSTVCRQPFSVSILYAGKTWRLSGRAGVVAVMALVNRTQINSIDAGGVRFDWGVSGPVKFGFNGGGRPMDEAAAMEELERSG